jgi:hypothetical protein
MKTTLSTKGDYSFHQQLEFVFANSVTTKSFCSLNIKPKCIAYFVAQNLPLPGVDFMKQFTPYV